MFSILKEVTVFKKSFGEDAVKVLLLLLTAVAYPLLLHIGKASTLPLLVVVREERIFRMLIEVMSTIGIPPVKTLAELPKDIRAWIQTRGYCVALIRFQKSRYTSENLQILERSCSEITDENLFPSMKIVLSVGGVEPELMEKFCGALYINGDGREGGEISDILLVRDWIEYLEKKFSIPLENTEDTDWIGEQEDVDMFYLVGDLLKTLVRHKVYNFEEVSDFLDEIDEALRSIKNEWYAADEPLSYAESFRKLLLAATEWLPAHICNRFELHGADVERLEDTIFYDEKYYYLSQEIFSDICKPLTKVVSANYLKAQLAASGLLGAEGNNRNYWTKEREFVTSFGQVIRKRMVAIARTLIDRDGEPTLVELLEMKGE